MAWLVRDDEVLASLEIADTAHARRVGLLYRDGIDGAILLMPTFAVHTMGMRFDLDVAYLSGDFRVRSIRRMRRNRIGLPRLRARAVLEAEAGSFDRWQLRRGDQLQPMREDED
jgi:uncharacterized protein